MISIFELFSIGIGPSSSHTVGPMKAAFAFVNELANEQLLTEVDKIEVELFGSLGQTGVGHGTGKAVILGLSGHQPDSIDVDIIEPLLAQVQTTQTLSLYQQHDIAFPNKGAIVFHRRKTLPKHSNAMTFRVFSHNSVIREATYYSIGGGFIVKDEAFCNFEQSYQDKLKRPIPYPFNSASELVQLCKDHGVSISYIMQQNELSFCDQSQINSRCAAIWEVMQQCIARGKTQEGILPGGLKVVRRAPALSKRLKSDKTSDPMAAMDWINVFALAVNEENAAGGRVVTAPTNGAAGIIPAVMAYYDKFIETLDIESVKRFLFTAAAVGILYKKNASISGAEVGCQGEVGVACSMAAAGLTELLGGSIEMIENAAEIGMEHNLGLTCDPVGGLVQVPCIERNAMGAIKAINAARLAMRGTGTHKVTLDKVIKTMRDTGRDMKKQYKETARGGLAVNIIEC